MRNVCRQCHESHHLKKNLFLPRIQTKMEQVVSYELHKNMQINFTFLNPTILTQMDHDSGQMEYPPEK